MLAGGESGPSIVPGDPENSELYRRITLPEDHDDFMPAEGKTGFKEDQVALIRWWIEQGAPATKLLVSMEVESSVSSRSERVLGLRAVSGRRLTGNESHQADTATLRLARDTGFIIERIAQQTKF